MSKPGLGLRVAARLDPRGPGPLSLRVLAGATLVFGGAIVALIVSSFWDGGRDVGRDFVSVSAQVIPVVFLAAMLELRAAIVRTLGAESVSENSRTVASDTLRAYVWMFILSEGLMLWSMASDTRTTFVVLAPWLTTLMMLQAMVSDLRMGVGLAPQLSEVEADQMRQFRDLKLTQAARLQRQAEVARQQADLAEREAAEWTRLADDEDVEDSR